MFRFSVQPVVKIIQPLAGTSCLLIIDFLLLERVALFVWIYFFILLTLMLSICAQKGHNNNK